MSTKNYVCIACGQDFTRRYSANRHSRHLHEEGSQIVRTLEYIIGRTTGEYSPADPVLFRRKRREQTTTDTHTSFPFANVAHDGESSYRYATTKDRGHEINQDSSSEPAKKYEAQISGNSNSSKREQIKSLYKNVFPNAEETVLKRVEHGIEHMENEAQLETWLQSLKAVGALFRGFEKPVEEEIPLRLHPDLWGLPHEAKSKLAEIERTMYRLNINPPAIFEEIKRLGNAFRNTRDLEILASRLDYLQRDGEIK